MADRILKFPKKKKKKKGRREHPSINPKQNTSKMYRPTKKVKINQQTYYIKLTVQKKSPKNRQGIRGI